MAMDPMMPPLAPGAPAQGPGQQLPDNYTERLIGLATTHPWMPHQTVATLAGLPQSDQSVATIANTLKNMYGTVDHAVKYVQDDPLLQKQPSLGLYIRSYLTNTIGPMPLVQSDLQHLQEQLLARGFNGGFTPPGMVGTKAELKADGVWSSAWNSVFNEYLSSIRAQALGGTQIGSVPVGRAMDAINQVLPRQAATSLFAFIKHLPDSVVSDFHNIAGAVGGAVYDVSHNPQGHLGFPTGLFQNATPQELQGEHSYSAAFENAAGATVTPQQSFAAQPLRRQSMDVLQIAADVLATHGLLKAGGSIADAARATRWASLDATAAQRGPGTVASKLFGPTVEGTTNKLPLLGKGAVNVPILRMTGPVADAIAGGDSYYYRARTLLAAPYAVPGVRVAGAAVGQLGYQGAKIRGLGALESVVGGQTSPLSQAIDQYQGVNQFDQAVQNRLQFTAFGHHFRPGMNTLAFILHPQLNSADTISAAVGNDVTGLTDTTNSIFGPSTGFGVSIERGMNWTKHGDQNMSYNDMVEMAGGPANYNMFWAHQIEQHAAALLAEDEWSRMPAVEQDALVGPNAEFQDKAAVLTDLANGYLQRAAEGDVAPILKAGEWLITDDASPAAGVWGGHNGLAKRIAGQIDREGLTPRQWAQKYMANYGRMSQIMRDVIIPRRNEFVSDEVPGSAIGVATSDYLSLEKAHADINMLEKRYNDAVDELHGDNPGPDSWKNFEDAASAIRAYLRDQFAIDGPRMPQSDQDMIKLLRQKADAQNPRLFPRQTATRLAPGDEKPVLKAGGRTNLHPTTPDPRYGELERNYRHARDVMGQDPMNDENMAKFEAASKALQDHLEQRGLAQKPELHGDLNTLPRGQNRLDRYTDNPVFTKVKPSQAMELVHEGTNTPLHSWTNDRRLLGQGGGIVTIEHDPVGLQGEIDPGRDYAGQEAQGGSARFLAQRDNGTGWNEDIRSVAFKANQVGKSGKEATALNLLRNQLERVGYIKVETEQGYEKWVRPDLLGGTVATSPQAQEALDELARLGYFPVQGKGIGFGFHNNNLFDIGDTHLALRRRWLENLGLSPENVPSRDIGFTWNMEFNNRLQQKVDDGKIRLYPTHMAQTIISMMRDRDALPAEPGMASLVQHTVGRHAYNINFKRMTEELMGHGMDQKEAQSVAAARLSQELENPLGLVHLTKGDLRKILSVAPKDETQMAREAEYQGITTGTGTKMYDEKDINEIYRTIQETNAAMPARLIGWQKAENMMALGLSYMGRPIPGSAGRALEYLPTRLITLRNKARFTLSPEFQARRVVKANVKISMDGVPPTFFPMRALMRGGIKAYKEKMAFLDRVMPEMKNPNYDEGTQALFAEDPWGIYNHRNFEAYAADHWRKMGKTDSEIRQLIIKDFGYGSKAYGEGRSALERSTNFVFFPFSFDKTLYRNTGAYLLDHTAQRLILQAGLEAYARYNQSDPNGEKIMSSNWWQDRAPIINEALRMNAFAHGLGLGQFGGINAPLLNLFIPQSYASSSQGVSTLRGILPIMREFQDLYKETTGTFDTTKQVISDQFIHNPTLQGFKGKNQTAAEALQGIFFAKPVAETPTAEMSAAYLYRRQLQALFKNEVDYNAHHTNKFHLGENKSLFGQWAGHVVNATLIDFLTNQRYPAYAPDQSQIFYDQSQEAINIYSLQMQNAGRPDVVNFLPLALKVGKAIYDGKLDSAQAARDTKIVRNIAIEFAETVPGFLTFYQKNLQWQFGPLEKVR